MGSRGGPLDVVKTERHLRKCLLTACALSVAPAYAQTGAGILTDPMRPPDAREATSAAAAPAGMGVQVILTSPERKLAVIDGRVVPMGGDARGGTLVGLSDTAAVVEKQGGRDVLLVHPAIDKKPPSTAARK